MVTFANDDNSDLWGDIKPFASRWSRVRSKNLLAMLNHQIQHTAEFRDLCYEKLQRSVKRLIKRSY